MIGDVFRRDRFQHKYFSALLFLLLSVLTFLFFPASYASERILSFDSRIIVHKDSTMTVTETIKVNAEGNQIKRGIYRDFPTIYKGGYTVGFTIREVKRDAVADSYHTENLQNGIRVYIGKSNVFITRGEHTYELTYETDRQLGFFEDHDELYWNVTGNGWIFPIEKASATVILPDGIPADKIKTDGYTGPQGSKAKEFTTLQQQGNPYFITTQPLGAYEGLTIVVEWPKGYITQPPVISRPREVEATASPKSSGKMKFVMPSKNKVILGELLVLIIVAYYTAVWARFGRDPQKGVVVPLFAPPRGISPAACRYIMKMSYDNKSFSAALISMAVKGNISIIEKNKKYTIKRSSADASNLTAEEKGVLAKLLGNSAEIELENSNHKDIKRAIDSLKNSLKIAYEKAYFITNTQYFVPGLILSIAILAASAFLTASSLSAEKIGGIVFMSVWLTIWTLGVVLLLFTVGSKWKDFFRGKGFLAFGEAVFISLFALPFVFFEIVGAVMMVIFTSSLTPIILLELVILNLLFYHLLKAPTLAGRAVMDNIEGFKMYLGTAEKDEIRGMGAPAETPQLFEKYLPYAIALDMENAWGRRFTEVLSRAGTDGQGYSPVWYSGLAFNSANVAAFASSMGDSLSTAISSSSTAPGSSSGGGGGGSSGGGGGGGGGGGW